MRNLYRSARFVKIDQQPLEHRDRLAVVLVALSLRRSGNRALAQQPQRGGERARAPLGSTRLLHLHVDIRQ